MHCQPRNLGQCHGLKESVHRALHGGRNLFSSLRANYGGCIERIVEVVRVELGRVINDLREGDYTSIGERAGKTKIQ